MQLRVRYGHDLPFQKFSDFFCLSIVVATGRSNPRKPFAKTMRSSLTASRQIHGCPPKNSFMVKLMRTRSVVGTTATLFFNCIFSVVSEIPSRTKPTACCSKVIMSGVNGNVIMSGCGDDHSDDERREAA